MVQIFVYFKHVQCVPKLQPMKIFARHTFTCIYYAQSVDQDNRWIVLREQWIYALSNNPWIVCANCGSTLCATQSQAPQTKGTGRNLREGSQSATQGNVKDSYLGVRILRCSL